jgi:multidrug efflux pump subunit AcrB
VNIVAALRARASFVVLATLSAMAFGAISLKKLPSGIYPEVDFPRIVCVAHVGDLPPEVMQTTATRPLEESLATVPSVRRIRSRTIRGAVEISAQFEPGTDMWRALQQAESRVDAVKADLPPETELQVERVTPSALPILTFNVSGPDPRVVREAASYQLRPALTRVRGVGDVVVQGGDVREIEVALKPEALAAAHLRPSEIVDRLAAEDLLVAAGRALEEHQVLTVMVSSQQSSVEEIAALPVTMGAGGPEPLSAVADVFEGAEDRTINIAGPPGDVVVVSVSRLAGASAPDVAAAARSVVAGIALPAGVRVDKVYDQSELIDDAMHGVRDAIILGVALSFVVLAIFLRDLRAGVSAAVAVPITLLITFGAMRLVGQTLNLMSLGGLAVAIGLVVDDAIVIVEAIVRRAEEGLPIEVAAERGTSDLFAAVVGTTLTTIVVFAPLGLLAGVIGAFFGALAMTLSAAVLLSLVVSVTVVPLLAGRILKLRPAQGEGRLAVAYGRLVRRIVRHGVLSALVIVLLGAGGWVAWRHVGTGFLPTMDEGAFVLDFFFPPGTSLAESDRIARQIDRVLMTTPSVVTFTRRVGAEMGPAAATQQNRGDILVRLVSRDHRKSVFDVMDGIRDRVAKEVPEARVEFAQILQDELDDLSGNPRPIEVRIFGPDPTKLDDKAHLVAAKIENLDELEDFFNGIEGDVPTLMAKVKPREALQLGTSPDEVAKDLGVALGGKVAAKLRLGDRTIGVRVRLPDEIRFDPDQIENLPLAYGKPVPLSAVSTMDRPVGPSVLTRENLSPVIIMDAATKTGVDLGTAARAVKQHLEGIDLGRGYRFEVGGQVESAGDAQRELLGVLGLGVALVLGILIVQLRSLRLALVVLLGAPLALVGAIVTLVLAGVPLNASSLMGCVLLAGLVVKNGILLLERARHEHETGVPFAEALARAGERRLRPILMTTAATIAGLFPLALGFGAGSELQRPLAIATLGGLVLSTLVTLFAVPALAHALIPSRDGASKPPGA